MRIVDVILNEFRTLFYRDNGKRIKGQSGLNRNG